MNDRFPLLDLKEGPRKTTPVARDQSFLRQSSVADLKRATDLATNKENSPPSVTVITRPATSTGTRSKSSITFVTAKKEQSGDGNASQSGSTPPISTPSRLQKGDSSRNGSRVTFKDSTPTPASGVVKLNSVSPKTKSSAMSARLSRPFSMSIPDNNRPFDPERPSLDEASRPHVLPRLSVAPRYVYGETESDTALPRLRDEKENRPGTSQSGKRMVSNFLKSRRNNKSEEKLVGAWQNSSPAFV